MKFRAERDDLAREVGWVGLGVPRRPTVPVLGGILVEVEPGKAKLSVFDYDISLATEVDIETEDTGRFLVPGPLFVQIANDLPNHPLTVDVDDSKAVITCGPGGRYTMPLMPVEDYPVMPSIPAPQGEIDGAVFAEAVAQTEYAASKDDTLTMLAGVYIVLEDTLAEFIATDRYRLPRRRAAWNAYEPRPRVGMTIPTRILNTVAKIAHGPLQLAVTTDVDGVPQSVAFACGARRATARVINTDFPEFRERFDGYNDPAKLKGFAEVLVDASALIGAAKRSLPFRDNPNEAIRLKIKGGRMQIEAGFGAQSMVEPLDAEINGPDMEVGFNGQFLMDGLNALKTRQTRLLLHPKLPTMIRPVGDDDPAFEHILMPIRLAS